MLGRLARSSRIVVLLKTPLAQGVRRHALPLVGGSAVGLAGACVFSAATTSCNAGTGAEPAGPSLLQKCVAEAIGTGMIVAGGCGVVCAAKYAGHAVTPLGIGAAFGLSVTLAIYATAGISGAHLNPAVTVAILSQGGISVAEAGCYMAAQVVGAAAAAGFNFIAFSGGITVTEAAAGVTRGACAASAGIFSGAFGMVPNALVCTVPMALLVETVITAGLVFCIFAFTDAHNKVAEGAAPVLIGTTVAVLVQNFAPITQAGMNPARDLGPRLITLCAGWGGTALSSGWWVYTVGPLAGGVLGAFAYAATLGAAHKTNSKP